MDNAYIAIAKYIAKNKDRPAEDITLESVARFANLALAKEKSDRLKADTEEIEDMINSAVENARIEKIRKNHGSKLKNVLSNQELGQKKTKEMATTFTDKLNDVRAHSDKLWTSVTFAQNSLSEKIEDVFSHTDKISEKTAEKIENVSVALTGEQQSLKDELRSVKRSVDGVIGVEQIKESVLAVLPKIEQEQIMIEETGQIVTLEK